MNRDPHQPLRDDVRTLGELFGDTLRAFEGDALFALVEEVRALAKRAHGSDAGVFEQLAARLGALPLTSAVPIARAFAQFLTLANIAEQHHRVRRRRAYARDPGEPQPGSCAEAFARCVRTACRPGRLQTLFDPCGSSSCSRRTRLRSFAGRCSSRIAGSPICWRSATDRT